MLLLVDLMALQLVAGGLREFASTTLMWLMYRRTLWTQAWYNAGCKFIYIVMPFLYIIGRL